MVYMPKDQITRSKQFAKQLILSLEKEAADFNPKLYDETMNVDTIMKFALARESVDPNRCAALLCHFDPSLGTMDYVNIGDIHMLHISEVGTL